MLVRCKLPGELDSEMKLAISVLGSCMDELLFFFP